MPLTSHSSDVVSRAPGKLYIAGEYAVVEPGVTFQDLYDHCVARKLKVWPSVPSLGWGSVIGNVSAQASSS